MLYPSSKATSIVLDDLNLTMEILIRLPGKSIVRSRGVSKLWSSCTTPEWFKKSFTAQSLKSPRLIIYSIQGDNLVGFSLPQDGTWDKSSSCCSAVDSYVIKYPKDCDYSRLSSVHGLYYFPRLETGLLIWNPTMRRFSNLTKPKRSNWRYATGFVGYDPIDDIYKALFLPKYPNPKPKKENSNLPHVRTLGREEGKKEPWRVIQGSFEHVALEVGPCINGVLYYKSYLIHDESESCFVMSFHVRSEKFNMIQLPWKKAIARGTLLTYQGKLACLRSHTNDAFISLWVLKDAERHEWSNLRVSSLPFPLHDPISQTSLHLVGATHAGEFVYSPSKLMSPFHVLYFNPLRNSFRRVVYQGIADEEFMRRYGLGNLVATKLEAFPNHIETFVSF